MDEYIIRLCHHGFSINQAYGIFFQLVKEGGYHALECYIAELEDDDVD